MSRLFLSILERILDVFLDLFDALAGTEGAEDALEQRINGIDHATQRANAAKLEIPPVEEAHNRELEAELRPIEAVIADLRLAELAGGPRHALELGIGLRPGGSHLQKQLLVKKRLASRIAIGFDELGKEVARRDDERAERAPAVATLIDREIDRH